MLFAAFSYAYYLWNKPQANMQRQKIDATLDASTLYRAFTNNETEANARYLGKTLAITGTVRSSTQDEAGQTQVVLETGEAFGVVGQLDPLSKHPRTNFPPGSSVRLKGICSGFNFDVQLTRCVEITP